MKKAFKTIMMAIMLVTLTLIIFSCTTSRTLQIPYLQSDRVFFTMGDDPGSESQKPYIPKGAFIHVESESHIPFPILGLITFGNADPSYVFDKKVLPKVLRMGGDALTNITIVYQKRPHPILRFFGLGAFAPSSTIIMGQVVKR